MDAQSLRSVRSRECPPNQSAKPIMLKRRQYMVASACPDSVSHGGVRAKKLIRHMVDESAGASQLNFDRTREKEKNVPMNTYTRTKWT